MPTSGINLDIILKPDDKAVALFDILKHMIYVRTII